MRAAARSHAPTRWRTPGPTAAGIVAITLLCGCHDLSRYSTGWGEAYCGQIVQGRFARAGFAPSVRLRMTFDATQIDSSPGTLSTDEGTLASAPMRAVPELLSDPLSMLNFGDGRERNLVYVVDPADVSNGPSLLAFVSLMHDGTVEVRLLRGAPAVDGGPPPPQDGRNLFGVFSPMRRLNDSCGF